MNYIRSNKVISKDNDIAQTLNFFFFNIATNLEIPEYIYNNSRYENAADPFKEINFEIKLPKHTHYRRSVQRKTPTNTPRVFQVETTWKRPFPRRFNLEYTWCVCRDTRQP